MRITFEFAEYLGIMPAPQHLMDYKVNKDLHLIDLPEGQIIQAKINKENRKEKGISCWTKPPIF